MARFLSLVLTCFMANGCRSSSRSCTEIGCDDSVSITVSTANDHWPAGEYAIDFTVDEGPTHTCALRVPEDVPEQQGRSLDLPCEPQLSALLIPKTVCVDERSQWWASVRMRVDRRRLDHRNRRARRDRIAAS